LPLRERLPASAAARVGRGDNRGLLTPFTTGVATRRTWALSDDRYTDPSWLSGLTLRFWVAAWAIRASGAGLAAGAGRLVGAFAPTLVGVMLARFGTPYAVFVVFAAVMLGGALVVLILGDETRGKSLEEISETRLAA